MPESVFVKPPDGWVGDVIPFSRGREAQLHYLHARRGPEHGGMSWHRFDTHDFAHFTDLGESLPGGTITEPDFNVYTGCIVASAEVTHAFYTGYNPGLHAEAQPARQLVMHATRSSDGDPWLKHPRHTFGAPPGYEPVDFRDPFVFQPVADGPWHMLVIARRDEGADRRRGVILDFVSADLQGWAFEGEFWAPNRYVAVECPEVFELAGRWYLVYSEFSERFATHYRVGPTPFGPWSVPECDTLDGRAFYAAKSLLLNGRRYFAGWIPTRLGESDDGPWEWGGTLATHEARALPDGALALRPPQALLDRFSHRIDVVPSPVIGDWHGRDGGLHASAPDGLAVAVTDDAPSQFLLEATIDIDPGTTECGIILRASEDGSEGYLVRLEPRRNRLVFDRWPRLRTGEAQWQISGDVPFLAELERPIDCTDRRHHIKVIVDGTICVVYVDHQVAMSTRIYDRREGGVGVFVGEGSTTFSQIGISTTV